jgi:hypothetical protein
MNGILPGVDYAALISSPALASGAANTILGLLYGGGAAAGPPIGFAATGNPILDLGLARRNEADAIAREARQPEVLNDINAFKSAVAGARTIQDALLNPAIQKVLLTANGLAGYIGDTVLVQKALLSDPSDPSSLVRRMGDGGLLSTVATYDFAKRGLAQLRNPLVVATLANGYAQLKWQQSLDQATPGLSNALAFLGQAGGITSAADILDNMTNFQVVTTALGIPQQIINLDFASAERELGARIDFTRLQDPAYVTGLTDQYLLNMQAQSGAGSGGALNILA